ncbi:MAG TPA: SCP2 sterol-binding domain-containing protein [Candidatus Lokiarchaeia archaeon]|nr:SCP2 sterol-binding domain-containing protein [Candidatus Lokiarchaeia archaeon]
MVDQDLINDLKERMDAGAENSPVEGIFKVFEFFKQIADENDEMKDELKDLDLLVQVVITDIDKKYFMRIKDGIIEYGEGEAENPTFIFSTTWTLAFDMVLGKVDATAEYMAGNVSIEGSVADAMSFQGVIELAMEIFQDLIK